MSELTGSGQHAAPPLIKLRPPRGWSALRLHDLLEFRDLLIALAGRDVKLRYKQTILGVLWVVLQPLLAAGIFTFVFGMVAGLKASGPSYFAFSFAGLLGWTAFASTLNKCSMSMVGNAHLVSKVYFPRLILPLSTLGSTLVDFAVSLIVMFAILGYYRIAPGAPIALLPLWLFLILAIAIGLGLFAAAMTVSYRDVQYILPVLVPFLMYASPVAYDVSAAPAHLQIYLRLNPMTSLLEGLRWSLLSGSSSAVQPPVWSWVAYSGGCAIVALIAGALVFKRMERRFADVI